MTRPRNGNCHANIRANARCPYLDRVDRHPDRAARDHRRSRERTTHGTDAGPRVAAGRARPRAAPDRRRHGSRRHRRQRPARRPGRRRDGTFRRHVTNVGTMSLILVVEPDSLHAAQLQSMARTHLHAELVMADSADRAVAALAHRVPDIVLTAPLLPGHDEEVLSKYLRALGTAAAHVQTLTIPILSAAAAVPERTMLGRFRRERPRTEDSDGCDPAMFADQIGHYLRRARQTRGDVPVERQAPSATPAMPPRAPIPRYAPGQVACRCPRGRRRRVAGAVGRRRPAMAKTLGIRRGCPWRRRGRRGRGSLPSDDAIVMASVEDDVDLSELLNRISHRRSPASRSGSRVRRSRSTARRPGRPGSTERSWCPPWYRARRAGATRRPASPRRSPRVFSR